LDSAYAVSDNLFLVSQNCSQFYECFARSRVLCSTLSSPHSPSIFGVMNIRYRFPERGLFGADLISFPSKWSIAQGLHETFIEVDSRKTKHPSASEVTIESSKAMGRTKAAVLPQHLQFSPCSSCANSVVSHARRPLWSYSCEGTISYPLSAPVWNARAFSLSWLAEAYTQ